MSQRDEAVMLEQEILEQLKNGGFRLADGLPYGTGDDAEMQYDVTFRELTAGDIIDAQLASERVVEPATARNWCPARRKWASSCYAARLAAWAASRGRCR